MGTNSAPVRHNYVAPGRLWFGLLAGAAAWLTLGFIDLLIVWQVCGYASSYGVDKAHGYARIAEFVISVILFVTAVTGGTVSYRNLRSLSSRSDLLSISASDRREFMAMIGVIVSVTLGVGIVWLSIPPLIIELCVRTK